MHLKLTQANFYSALRNPSFLAINILMLTLSAILYYHFCTEYMALNFQSNRDATNVNFTDYVLHSFFSWNILLLTILTPIVSQYFSKLNILKSSNYFWQLSSLSVKTIHLTQLCTFIIWLVIFCLSTIVFLAPWQLSLRLDWGLILCMLLALTLTALVLYSVSMLVSTIFKNTLLSLLTTWVIIGFCFSTTALSDTSPIFTHLSWQTHLQLFRFGIVTTSDVSFFALLLLSFLTLRYLLCVKTTLRAVKGFALITACVSSYYAMSHINQFIALSHNNDLTTTTKALLNKLESPLNINLYSNQAQVHLEMLPYMYRAKQIKPSLYYEWHAKVPQAIQAEQPYAEHILTVTYQDNVYYSPLNASPSEAIILQAIIKTLRPTNTWVSFLSGHQEASIYDASKTGLSLFNLGLQNQGFQTSEFNSQELNVIPSNISFLVVASPQTALLPKETDMLRQYLDAGKNILYLSDPKSFIIEPLESLIGLHWHPGTVVDALGQKMGTPHPAITLVQNFRADLPFNPPKQLVALPWSKAFYTVKQKEWQVLPILVSNDQSWTETRLDNAKIQYDADLGEQKGPLTLGAIFTRTINGHEQRIIVVGNSRFLRNSSIQNYGNLAFGINICNWLQRDETLAQLPQAENDANPVSLHFVTAWLIQYGYTFILPLFLTSLSCIYIRRRIKLNI